MKKPMVKGSSKNDPFASNGGNGGYARRQQLKYIGNPKKSPKSPKRPIDYNGDAVSRAK